MTELLHSLVAGRAVVGRAGTARSTNPATGHAVGPDITLLDIEQVAEACVAARAALAAFRDTSPADRAAFLDACAEEIEALGDDLLDTAVAESGLPLARIAGERARTTGQLRLFADVARRGAHRGVRIDPALPDRQPLPRPDLRVRFVPLGPVAVFGASNFPLAFSTAGGDTASALAAGCPVVVKAHPAHRLTSLLVGTALARAAERTGMPPGVVSVICGPDPQTGQALVTDPHIAAVGFTGSRAGGQALFRAAQERTVPIPVFAELSAVNPVVILPGALDADPRALAAAYVGSLTLGSGQFCTNPGLLYLPDGQAGDAFLTEVGRLVDDATGQTMLTEAISASYTAGRDRLASVPGVVPVGRGAEGDGPNAPAPAVVTTKVEIFLAEPTLADEVFGASGVVIRWGSTDDLVSALSRLEGQLTATIHGTPTDTATVSTILPVLEERVGRIVFGGWPTGVEVTHAMVHGGPWPATTAPATTSVGTLAIERWQRPVCYQGFPDDLLPTDLQADNPWALPRQVDGEPV